MSLAMLLAVSVLVAPGAEPAAGASRSWHPCSKTATKAAAAQAGLPARMDADERLRRART